MAFNPAELSTVAVLGPIGVGGSGYNSNNPNNGVSPNKQLMIYNSGGARIGQQVAMILDDTIDFRVKSNFSTLEDTMKNFKLTSVALDAYESARETNTLFGTDIDILSGKLQPLDIPIWTGSDPLDFTVNVSFFTLHGGGANIMSCVRDLMAMQLPEEGNGVLTPPFGKASMGAFFNENNYKSIGRIEGYLQFQFGNILRLDQVLITNVSPTFSTEIDKLGYPIQIELTIDGRTRLAATKTTINNGFNIGVN